MAVLDETIIPSEADVENAKRFSRELARDHAPGARLTIHRDGDGESIEVPPHVLDVLMKVLVVMAKGKAFSLIPMDKELTTQQAADMLNVSRPYLNKILDLGEITHRKVGRHRRIKFCDLIKYKNAQEKQSTAALQKLADDAQELDLGY